MALTAVDTAGWRLTWASIPANDPDSNPLTFTVTWKGYTAASLGSTAASAATTTLTEDIVVGPGVRDVPPNEANPLTNIYASTEYLFSSTYCTLPGGATNNSTLVPPTAICTWGLPDREVVSGTITQEIIVYHHSGRNGTPVAGFWVTATDGTNTVEQKITTPIRSTNVGDALTVTVYAVSLNVSTLNNASLITVNAKAYPHVGDASNGVADSSTGSGQRGWYPVLYWRDTTVAATPHYAYIDNTATDDTTGVWSTTYATAVASPFKTIGGARDTITNTGGRGIAANANGDRIADGAIIRCKTGQTHVLPNRASAIAGMKAAAPIIEPEPSGTITLTAGASSFKPNLGGALAAGVPTTAARIRKGSGTAWTLQRSGASQVAEGVKLILENGTYDPNGNTGTAFYAAGGRGFFLNVTSSASVGSSFAYSANGSTLMWRGCNFDFGNNGADMTHAVGNTFKRLGVVSFNNTNGSNTLIASNKILDPGSGSGMFGYGSSGTLSNAAFCDNLVVHFLTTNTNANLALSKDAPQTGNIANVIVTGNTWLSANVNGRWNIFYDENTATPRTHSMCRVANNIISEVNMKSAEYVYYNDGDTVNGPNMVGNWAMEHGVGFSGNIYYYPDAFGTNGSPLFSQFYPGRNAVTTSSRASTTRDNILFTSDKAQTWNGSAVVAGIGSSADPGNYQPAAASTAKARGFWHARSWYGDGAATSIVETAGVYSYSGENAGGGGGDGAVSTGGAQGLVSLGAMMGR